MASLCLFRVRSKDISFDVVFDLWPVEYLLYMQKVCKLETLYPISNICHQPLAGGSTSLGNEILFLHILGNC